jgi:hypothetical protein
MSQQGVEGVLADRDALRTQVVVELVDAENRARVAQQLAHQPPQDADIAHLIPFHHIPQDDAVDIGHQQLASVNRLQPDSFGEAAFVQVLPQSCLNLRSLRLAADARTLFQALR